MDWMVLDQFFPYDGIAGVDETPIYGDEVDELRDALGVGFSEEVLFHRIGVARGRAEDWFVPGDVVCRRIGLSEDRCDLLRALDDRVFLSYLYDSSAYSEELESLRSESIEQHKWSIHRSGDWIAIVDPQGRAFKCVFSFSLWLYPKIFEELEPRGGYRGLKPPYRVSAAWLGVRVIHRYLLNRCGPKLRMAEVFRAGGLGKYAYYRREELGSYLGSARMFRMHRKKGFTSMPFWERCVGMLSDGLRVPNVVKMVDKHPSLQFCAVTSDEVDWVFERCWWPELDVRGGAMPCVVEKYRQGIWRENQNWK